MEQQIEGRGEVRDVDIKLRGLYIRAFITPPFVFTTP